MMMVGNGTTLTSALFEKLPYDLVKDFAHVSTLASSGRRCPDRRAGCGNGRPARDSH